MLKNLESLKDYYQVFIPTTIFDETAPHSIISRVKNEVKSKMVNAFGGYTELIGIGGYVSNDGKLIEEQVFIVESYYEKENDDLIIEIANSIKTAMKQESILVKKNNQVYFL